MKGDADKPIFDHVVYGKYNKPFRDHYIFYLGDESVVMVLSESYDYKPFLIYKAITSKLDKVIYKKGGRKSILKAYINAIPKTQLAEDILDEHAVAQYIREHYYDLLIGGK